jgi:hypothetical protein
MMWAEIVALYRLTLDRPPHNLQPRYNVCPTVPECDDKRDFVWIVSPQPFIPSSELLEACI